MHTLSIVIPSYNEEATIKTCVERVLEIADETLKLELIIVDDASTDNSYEKALELQSQNGNIQVLRHEKNKGKGAALRTGFAHATGDFVAVQDADLEYDPMDLKKLIEPLVEGDADVVFGSRFLSSGVHRVLYFWHSLANKFLTFLSNMFTDLNLTDMETCYKVFRRELIQSLDLKENRFGIEPEMVAKVAQLRPRVYEMGISYKGRTYEEGKKIGMKDAVRALYCIFHYNSHKAPVPIQFLIYIFIGGISAAINLSIFLTLYPRVTDVTSSALVAYFIAAAINYILCILFLFRHKARWGLFSEVSIYLLVVIVSGVIDLLITRSMVLSGFTAAWSKILATVAVLIVNFVGRRFFVFPEKPTGPWRA